MSLTWGEEKIIETSFPASARLFLTSTEVQRGKKKVARQNEAPHHSGSSAVKKEEFSPQTCKPPDWKYVTLQLGGSVSLHFSVAFSRVFTAWEKAHLFNLFFYAFHTVKVRSLKQFKELEPN